MPPVMVITIIITPVPAVAATLLRGTILSVEEQDFEIVIRLVSMHPMLPNVILVEMLRLVEDMLLATTLVLR